MNPLPLIWAVDADLIITIAIVLFGIVIPLILNVVNKLKEVQGKMAGGAGPQKPRPVDAQVEDEIGEFLRRAAARRQGEPAAQPAPKPPPRLVQEQPVEAVVLETVPRQPAMDEQVAHDIDTRKFDERARQTERRAAQASRKAQRRSRKKFDHEVAHLTGNAAAPLRPKESALEPEDRLDHVGLALAAGLPALLRNTQSLRQAIVINEILQRPEERWRQGGGITKFE